jgi:invasion protein IalB
MSPHLWCRRPAGWLLRGAGLSSRYASAQEIMAAHAAPPPRRRHAAAAAANQPRIAPQIARRGRSWNKVCSHHSQPLAATHSQCLV